MSGDHQVTIRHLEIRFDVAEDDQEAAFARLFTKYIELWGQAQEEQQERLRRSAADRAIGRRREEP